MKEFSERLKTLVQISGKSQSQIAKDLGVTPQAFSCFIHGREPNYATLAKIADYFQVSADFLIGREAQTTDGEIIIEHFKDTLKRLQNSLNLSLDAAISNLENGR